MFSRPEGLTDLDVVHGLEQGWGLDGVGVEYVPLGFGSYHWTATRGGERWFATADDLAARRQDGWEPLESVRHRLTVALGAARALREAGLDFVVAPVPRCAGELVRPVGAHHLLALYPFVDGEAGSWGQYPDAGYRDAVVRRLAALHGVPSSRCRDLPGDDLTLPHRRELADAMADLDRPWTAGPYADPARAQLHRHAAALDEALKTYDRTVSAVMAAGIGAVPTHGEPHPGNTIRTGAGVQLIDWDTVLLAPPERDLWDLAIEDPGVLDLYRDLTGHVADRTRMALYRLRWDLTEVCLYVDQFRRPHGRTADTDEAWDGLQQHLDPDRWRPALLDLR